MRTPLDLAQVPPCAASRPAFDVPARVAWMRAEKLWPAASRDLWTDAFGLVLLVSLHRLDDSADHLGEARRLVAAVERELQPAVAPIPHLALWTFALGRLARIEPEYRSRAVDLAREGHRRIASGGSGERSNRSRHAGRAAGPDALAPLHPMFLRVALDSLEAPELSAQVADLRERIERSYRDLVVTRDLGLGMMLWMTHFHPGEPWACLQWGRCLRVLELLWVDEPGFFCREPGLVRVKSAVVNRAISIGLQAVGAMPERVEKLRHSLRALHPREELGCQAATQVMACCAELPGELLCARPRA